MFIDGWDGVGQILTKKQIWHLFEGLDQDFKEIKILDLDLTHLDQDKLMNLGEEVADSHTFGINAGMLIKF